MANMANTIARPVLALILTLACLPLGAAEPTPADDPGGGDDSPLASTWHYYLGREPGDQFEEPDGTLVSSPSIPTASPTSERWRGLARWRPLVPLVDRAPLHRLRSTVAGSGDFVRGWPGRGRRHGQWWRRRTAAPA